jgi:two-component system, LytTR family, sensor kinase
MSPIILATFGHQTKMNFSIDKERFKVYMWIASAYLGLTVFGDLVGGENFFTAVLRNIWLVSFLLVLNYFLFERVVPLFRMTWKRILATPVILFMMLMIYSFGFYGWKSLGEGLHFYPRDEAYANVTDGVRDYVGMSFFSIFFFGVAIHRHDYRKLKTVAQQLRIEKQEAELNYLKSQTNPHFLFNTLNNIYSLARDKSDLAPESILRLSKILRFMLYEANGEYIAVEQELKVIGDYVALEQLRYDTSLRVNVSHDVEDMKQAVPPLLLMPLVENAFKHGVSESTHQPFVDIHLSIKNRILTFTVKNSAELPSTELRVKENIGLSNLRRQLGLLYVEYNLLVEHNNGVFIAILKINLASHA